MENGILDATTPLLTVIIKQLEGVFAQEHQGDEVAQRQQRHEKVTQVPNEIKTCDGTKEDKHTARQETEDGQDFFVLGQEMDIGLAIVIVTDDAAEGKEENRHSDKDFAPTAHLALQRGLGKLDALHVSGI